MRTLAMAVLVAVVAVGCGGDSSARTPADRPATAAGPSVDRFDEDRAWAWLERQVALGERPAGSATSRRLARMLRDALPNGRFDRVPGGLRNVVGHLPGRRPAVLLGAHYDTKDIPGFVGAEDGAGGTAAVVEIARALERMKRPKGAREVRFVLFDGEECPDDSREFYSCGLRGSRPYARRHADELGAVVVLDFIAQKDLAIPRETSSDPALWRRLRSAARVVGSLHAFPDATQGQVLDDHTPFLRAGVPSIDLIDFEFDCWHKTCDDLTAVSKRSLDTSGEAVLELMRRLRAGR